MRKECSEELLSTLAVNVIYLRQQLGMSQEKFAEAAGFHRTYISLIERKKRNVTLGVLEAMADALGVTVSDLLAPMEKQ
jgi:transcriptional regulator with XRE-family HTH domain